MERYYIRNCLNQIVGNPKGYATHKGADRQANMKTSKAFADIWNTFNVESDKMDAKGIPAADRLIYSIKLENPSVLVYRVEDAKGWGMYSNLWFQLNLPNDNAHPILNRDSLYVKNMEKFTGKSKSYTYEPDGHRFAFASIEMLRRWIYDDKWIQDLSDIGGVLCIYEVPADCVVVGRTQVTFNHAQAKEISRKPLASIL